MLITKTPFRISFCGGGSDLESFYQKHEGCVLSTSINKYMYISIHPYFNKNQTVLKYSKTEIVDDLSKIEHTIFNSVLNEYDLTGVEITSTSDIPAGTGLGSSSAFTVGLLNTINSYCGTYVSKPELARRAYETEVTKLKSPIGKQDQYATAVGGLNFISFRQDGSVSIEPVVIRQETKKKLQDNLVLFYLGITRSANDVLHEQKKNMDKADPVKNLVAMCDLAKEMKKALQNDDLSTFGNILHESWLLKRSLANGISNPMIDELYDKALKSGACGGKVLGAGGGGFFMFYCEPDKQEALRVALGLRPMEFAFEQDGSSVIYLGDL